MRLSIPLLVALVLLASCACSFAAESQADVIAKRRAMMAQKPYDSVVPRSKEPVGQLTVVRIWPDQTDLRIALASLQGLVNREQPRLYIGLDKILNWTIYHSGKIKIKVEPDIYKVFETYKDNVKGMVLYDYSQEALPDIAITYAGVEDLIPVTPELAEDFAKRYGWEVKHDLRNRWQDRLTAFKWSYDNLFPQCTKYALMHYTHGSKRDSRVEELEGGGHLIASTVDYAVENKMFVWYLGNKPLPGEMEFANKVMESVPFHTPVVGASGGEMYDEPALVSYVASMGNLHIPLYSYNLSVLSGVRIPDAKLKQKQWPVRQYEPNKIYVTFTNSEHDNMGHVIGGGPPWDVLGFETDDPYRIWWSDPSRGSVPIGWPIGPLLSELAPSILARLVMTQTENDVFMAALSGLCLTDLATYGSHYPSSQEDLLAEYSRLSMKVMSKLGWTMVNPWGPPAALKGFIENAPGLTAAFEGYTSRLGPTGYDRANYTIGGVPVFHALTYGIAGEGRSETISESYARRAKILVDQIKAIRVTERPAFVHGWTIGWDYSPTILKMVKDQLPKEYVVVRPDELATLFKQYKDGKAELKSVPLKPKPSGVVTETASGSDGLIVDSGAIRVEIPWGTTVQAPIKRVMGVDGIWRCTGKLYEYNQPERKVTSAKYERVKDTPGEKDYLLTYNYDNGAWMKLKLRAIAGRPYILIEDESNGGDMPSWSIHLETDSRPDRLYKNGEETALTYSGSDAIGELPSASWALVGWKDSRDLIGLYTVQWGGWNNGNILLWKLPEQAYFEVYYQTKGFKQFALAALDKNDVAAQQRLWKELNPK